MTVYPLVASKTAVRWTQAPPLPGVARPEPVLPAPEAAGTLPSPEVGAAPPRESWEPDLPAPEAPGKLPSTEVGVAPLGSGASLDVGSAL